MGIDDVIFDSAFNIVVEIIEYVKLYNDIERVTIPEEKIDEWYEYLWNNNIPKKIDKNLVHIISERGYELYNIIEIYLLKNPDNLKINKKSKYDKNIILLSLELMKA